MGGAQEVTTGSGIQEPQEVDLHVPGTEILLDLDGHNHLQHAKSGHGQVLLVPQPSLTDPNDPLRWPRWKKWMVFANALLYTFLGSNIGPIMSGGMEQQSAYFGIPIGHLSWAAGISLLCSGVSTIFWVPLFVKYGRRPVYLASTLITGAMCIWCGVAAKTTFDSFFAARAFVGWFIGPIESISASTITDIFFLHDRGEKISIWGLSILGGNEIVLSAYIIQGIGMSWAFYIIGIAIFASSLTIFFTMPETAYWGSRPEISLRLLHEGDGTVVSESPEKDNAPSDNVSVEKKGAQVEPHTDGAVEVGLMHKQTPKRPYIREMHPFPVVNSTLSLGKLFLRPFVLLTYPTVLWASLVYGMALAWNVILALTIAQLFAPPPYLFNSGAQGLIFLAPATGSLLATYLCGPLADQLATFYTRRNGGIREPEMRLPVAFMAAFFTFIGVAIAGPCYAHKTHWIGPIFGFGVLSIGAQMVANLAMTYCLDSHKELSGEVMTTISATKSVLAWTWSWFINDWITLNGMMTVYFIAAAINIVVLSSTFLLYFKGKQIRIRIQQRNLLGRLNLI
ncbi:major facilitator superfamily domain-containing protein [Exophiala viscosa]|uniref:Major facilitator superfamily domain-containing protein n=1 Tax=Exophiala viscosa TaxID=2486360 RepID=A0AAN6DT91_9EURO|nr:major facilitator superfamily domain-containing protein [Exophiala viscosa]